jgi:hypothetical protein
MRSQIAIGAGGGFVGGLAASLALSILGVQGHAGQIARPISLVAHTIRSDSLVTGCLVQIAITTVIGALFGLLYPVAGLRRESAAFWATAYGLAWWIVGWFAMMPPPLRYAPWAAVKDPALFQLAVAGLLAGLAFGAALAGAFTLFGVPEDSRRDARARAARVAPANGALSAGRR